MNQEINYSIDKSRFIEAISLSEAIDVGDLDAIQSLIKKHSVIKIVYRGFKLKCDSHFNYFPSEFQYFTRDLLYYSVSCNYGHKYCLECIKLYLKENFCFYYHNNSYSCIYCISYGVENTTLLYDQDLRNLLIELYGYEKLNQIANFQVIKENQVIMEQKNLDKCGICKSIIKKLDTICMLGHLCCRDCIENWVRGNYPIKCFIDNCQESINTSAIINALKDSPVLIYIKDKFREIGIHINFCPNCKKILDLKYNSNITVCTCGAQICNNCERQAHVESCFFYESLQEYEVIDLAPPQNPGKPKNLREQEYLNAKYAFEYFLQNLGSRKLKSARLIVNKPLERRYSQKKVKMGQECGGIDKVREVYIWHGSSYKNYDIIMREGLKVGGVDPGVPVSCGTAQGYGIYSSITADIPMGYARDSKWLLVCLAMRGIASPNPIFDVNLLDKGNIHCFESGNVKIFFTKEQVLPRFLVEYC